MNCRRAGEFHRRATLACRMPCPEAGVRAQSGMSGCSPCTLRDGSSGDSLALREGRVDRVAGPVQGCVHQHLVGLQPRISEHRVSQLHVAGHQQEQPVELGRDHPTVVGAGQTQATSTGGGWTGNELSQGPDSLARDMWSQPPLSPEGKTQQWQVPPPHPPSHVYPSLGMPSLHCSLLEPWARS